MLEQLGGSNVYTVAKAQTTGIAFQRQELVYVIPSLPY